MTTTTVCTGSEFSRDYYDQTDHWCNDPEFFDFDLAKKLHHDNIEEIFNGICESHGSTATLCLYTGEVTADIDDNVELDWSEIVQDAAEASMNVVLLAAETGVFDINGGEQ